MHKTPLAVRFVATLIPPRTAATVAVPMASIMPAFGLTFVDTHKRVEITAAARNSHDTKSKGRFFDGAGLELLVMVN